MHPITFALGLLGAAAVIGPTPARIENPPTPPLVASVPEKAVWTLATLQPETAGIPAVSGKKKKKKDMPLPVVSAPGPAASQALITQVRTTVALPLKHDEIVLANGEHTDNWYSNGALLISKTGSQISTSRISGVWDTTGPSIPSGFPGMSWIKPEFFDAIVTFRKQPCYHYVLPTTSGNPDTAEAWVHVENRLPAAYRRGTVTYVYEFGAPPTEGLTLPAPIQAAFDAFKESQDRQKSLEHELGGR